MRLLAAFVMRGRSQAVMSAVVLAMVSLLILPLSILSSAVIALVTLRQGQGEGLAVGGFAALASGLLALLLFANPAPAMVFVVLLWLPAFLAAMVLRATRSLALMVQGTLGVGLLIIGVYYLQVSDPATAWQQALEPLSRELVKAELLDEARRALFVEQLARWMTGLLAAGFYLQLVLSVFLARWWQATLYNPGGFRQEFHGLRLHRALGLFGLLLVGLIAFGLAPARGPILDLSVLLSAALLLQGLAVAHAVAFRRKAHRAWLVALYVLWLFAVPQIWIMLALVGFLDLWFDFRARVKAPGNTSDS